MSQIQIAAALAVKHLKCDYCGSAPTEPCYIVDGFLGMARRGELGAGFKRPVPHQVRLDPFVEAWAAGYEAHRLEQVQSSE